MTESPLFSLIVPTRNRPAQLACFIASIAETASIPQAIEVVLVIDEDDSQNRCVVANQLRIRQVIVPPGLTMGALNMAGYKASSGKYLMLLNDDVICRTAKWDTKIRACFEACPDDILLVHVNDTLMQTALCTFPVVSRTFCELAGGICPEAYLRYRIDDHIEDIFNLLGLLGERRTVYLPGVVFEHQNGEERVPGLKQYFSDEQILALDAPTFERLLPRRKKLAVALRAYIEKQPTNEQGSSWQRQLEQVTDSFAIRVPERLRIVTSFSRNNLKKLARRIRNRLPEPSPNPWARRILAKLKAARAYVRQSSTFKFRS